MIKIKKNKKLALAFAGVILFLIFFGSDTFAVIYPSYNNESDCRSCHAVTPVYIANRHHGLAAKNLYECNDCHPLQWDDVNQTYNAQVINNCLVCHPNKNHKDIHHALASQGLFECQDCHPLQYDEVNQTYDPYVTYECTECHNTVRSIQNGTNGTITPVPTPTPAEPIPPSITSFNPSSPVSNTKGNSRMFRITTDQITNITWDINGDNVQTNENVDSSSYNNMSADIGLWNVTANASNGNGSVKFIWTWNVSDVVITPLEIEFYAPYPFPSSPIYDNAGDSRKFGLALNQFADITWSINDVPVQSNLSENRTVYTNENASEGVWIVRADASNSNGSLNYTWEWHVRKPPVITSFPLSPVNDYIGDSRVFSILSDQVVNVSWYKNGTVVKTDENVTSSDYTEIGQEGVWEMNVSATNDNDTVNNTWIWNVRDDVPPVTNITFDGIGGLNDWFISNVLVNLTASDTGGSGLNGTWYNDGDDDIGWHNYTIPFTVDDNGIRNISYYSADNARNIEGTKYQTVRIDKTAPYITINIPLNNTVYTYNQNLIANWSANDIHSGLQSYNGTYLNGSTIDTSLTGTRYFTVNATDNAGNEALKNHTYYVRYLFGGYLDPINNDNTSMFKIGSNIPIKFQLKDANGNWVSDANASLAVSYVSLASGTVNEDIYSGDASSGNYFTYNSTGHFYMYNLGTKSGFSSNGKYKITTSINDGSLYSVLISFKR